jgi:hypothetical protein
MKQMNTTIDDEACCNFFETRSEIAHSTLPVNYFSGGLNPGRGVDCRGQAKSKGMIHGLTLWMRLVDSDAAHDCGRLR